MKKMTWGQYTLFGFLDVLDCQTRVLVSLRDFWKAFFNQQKALLLFEEMLKVQLQCDSISCRATIRACERGKQWQQVLALFASMSGWSGARRLSGACFRMICFFVWQTFVSRMGTWDGFISPWPMLVDRMRIQFRILICDIFHCWIPFRFSGVKNSADGWEYQVDEKDAELFFWTHLWICGCSCRVVLKNDLFKVVFYRHKVNHNTFWPNLS